MYHEDRRADCVSGTWAAQSGTGVAEISEEGRITMQGPLRGILAGAAAWKFGGGCISTILIFIIVFWALGYVRC
jgi:hypothetical protein